MNIEVLVDMAQGILVDLMLNKIYVSTKIYEISTIIVCNVLLSDINWVSKLN